jgi:hypothetical protein
MTSKRRRGFLRRHSIVLLEARSLMASKGWYHPLLAGAKEERRKSRRFAGPPQHSHSTNLHGAPSWDEGPKFVGK